MVGRTARVLEEWFVDRRWWEFLPIPLVVITLSLYHGPYWGPGGHAATYVLATVLGLANISLLIPRRPAWAAPTALIVLSLSGGLLAVVLPPSWTLTIPYLVASIAVRRYPLRGAALVVLTAMLSVAAPSIVHGNWLAVLASVAGLASLVMGSMVRRSRASRLEQVQLALAREQAAREEHARAAALAERARIAREVHDVLAHSLSALSLNLQGARLMLVRDGASADAVAQVERAQRLAADGLNEARRAVAALRDDPVPAARAVADLVTTTRLETGDLAEFELLGTPRELSGSAENTLFRTAQEALSNARKHAPGAPIRVVLDYQDGRTELTVTDHPGQQPSDAQPGGYGLTGMRERAELIGGELHTGPTEDGWQVRLVVPA
jgi:signal transduction histidine kinase